jgi:hypothetical protein
MKICIFGSSSKNTPKEFTDVGYELGLKIAEKNHDLIFGGGNDGMMGAVATGAFDNGCKITDISPKWIGEFDDKFENSTELIITDTINERKDLFLEKSDVFIVCPGGLGTLDEFFDFLALKYLNIHSKMIILFNIDNFYKKLMEVLDDIYNYGLIPEGALDNCQLANSVEDIFKIID